MSKPCWWSIALVALLSCGNASSARAAEPSPRPNILWITCEDISPNLGCYGDKYAVTPNLDRLATQGVRYTRAFAACGVCALSRSTIITGAYASSLGTHHMRCEGIPPDYVKCFSEYLRQAGYYCSNNAKTDYNFPVPREAWDQSNSKAHWRGRAVNQPFFAVFNLGISHESKIRMPEEMYRENTKDFTAAERHDPAKAQIPAYHPDTPEVRNDWARYADLITVMDKQAGEILQQLEADGLADDTIVFFYSDHGAGMPRSKRWLYDSSMRVPLIVRFPEKYAKLAPDTAGTTTDRIVSFVDFAPTMMSLTGLEIPQYMQGVAFLGSQAGQPRTYAYGFRDRMGERYDFVRSVRDERYNYIRNYMPQFPWFNNQYIVYMDQMPTMHAWQQLANEGKLSGPTAVFMAATKPVEELYDVENDPWEVRNLAHEPEHRERLERMRAECARWQLETIDLGFLPECDLRMRFGERPAFDVVRTEPGTYPIQRIKHAADLANAGDVANVSRLVEFLGDDDPAVRYWGAIGLVTLGKDAAPATDALRKLLGDPAPAPRIAAAEALGILGHEAEAVPVLAKMLTQDANEWSRLFAATVLDRLDERARAALPALETATSDKSTYVQDVSERAVRDLTPNVKRPPQIPSRDKKK